MILYLMMLHLYIYAYNPQTQIQPLLPKRWWHPFQIQGQNRHCYKCVSSGEIYAFMPTVEFQWLFGDVLVEDVSLRLRVGLGKLGSAGVIIYYQPNLT